MKKVFHHEKNTPNQLEKYCINPIYDVTTTILGVFTGLLGSLYNVEIRSTIPFTWSLQFYSHIALAFWVLLIVVTLLFYYRHKATHHSQAKLVSQTKSLENLIRTLPPDGFLTDFSRIYKLSHQAALYVTSKNETTQSRKDDIELSIRTILDGIVALTYTFDGKPQDIAYAANIMLYKDIGAFSDEDIPSIRENLMFAEKGTDIRHLKGLLELQQTLSTTTETEGATPDPDLRSFYLPMPINNRSPDGKRYRYLPGAPMAYILNTLNVNTDTADLGAWCREYGDFSHTLCNEVENYFLSEAAAKIKSFASLPISGATNLPPIGVLNIHRDTKGMLEEKEPVKQFLPLMQPFLSLLYDLLDERNSL